MRATDFEFRYRFGLIVLLHCVAFGFYYFDRVSFGSAVLHLFSSFSGASNAPGRGRLQLILGLGAAAVFAGALLRTWATAYMRANVVHDLSLHSHQLVADGPYRHTRNPLYVGVFLMAAGLGVAADRFGWFFLVAATSVYLYRLIRREEAELRQSQGKPYIEYCRKVPSFFPSLAPRVPSGGLRPRWGQAFVSELFIWTYGVAGLTYAVTLRAGPALMLLGAGFLINAVNVAAARRPQAAQA
ncbi:MAG TPA: isoprenylcysteine carboxylmethyltransferase family protein [Opitutaceae bacterium]|nr:isoprenylcysteine carboxylmethyltransferase family protein [Opitutaceae bacterium]